MKDENRKVESRKSNNRKEEKIKQNEEKKKKENRSVERNYCNNTALKVIDGVKERGIASLKHIT